MVTKVTSNIFLIFVLLQKFLFLCSLAQTAYIFDFCFSISLDWTGFDGKFKGRLP
jgi:hypothetical protein